jgi:hypothetical protein
MGSAADFFKAVQLLKPGQRAMALTDMPMTQSAQFGWRMNY